MNILFFTQGKTLDVFYQIYLRLRKKLQIDQIGFYVTNPMHYERFLTAHPDFENQFYVVKEWELYIEAKKIQPNLALIEKYEREIGDPTLWGPIVTDRRLYMGKMASFHQDYKPKFAYDEQLAIMDVALQKIDKMFEQVKPDLVCTIYTATFADCLGHLFAEARGIRSLDLRLARLKNYVMFVDGTKEPPPHIVKIFENFTFGIPDELKKQANEYIKSVVENNAMYEGVVPAANKQNNKKVKHKRMKLLSPKKLVKSYQVIKRYQKFQRYDYQEQGIIAPFLYKRIFNPQNLKKIKLKLKNHFVTEDQLKNLNYILYPLHTEPELVLSQFARPYLNQIEVVRNVSLSMPVAMKLLVKEHPMMLGRRSLGYYQKLLEIPNVFLVDLNLSSEIVLKHAKLVVIIRGAIGLEAVIKKKPVVSLGKSLFDLLPSSMFRKCRNLYELPYEIRDMIENYRYHRDGLVRYLAAVIAGSTPANLISDLLGKKGRFRTDLRNGNVGFEDHPHLDVLAEYLYRRIRNENAAQYCKESTKSYSSI